VHEQQREDPHGAVRLEPLELAGDPALEARVAVELDAQDFDRAAGGLHGAFRPLVWCTAAILARPSHRVIIRSE
jgi:hypothetical protein